MNRERRSRNLRETICYITERDQNISVFKPDPISWIPHHHVHSYRNDMSWHLLRITRRLNMECWRMIVDLLFAQHSQFLFSLVYQLSSSYCEKALPLLTANRIMYCHLKSVANMYEINIMLYKPNYIPQYLRVHVHYLNLIMSSKRTMKTMLVYSQPIECLYSLDFHFQLDSLRDLRYLEQIQGFFDLSRCLIDYTDFDKPLDIQASIDMLNVEQQDSIIQFRHKFNSNNYSTWLKYKVFVALWCELDDPKELNDCMDLLVCQINDDGHLFIPELRKELFDVVYKRKPLEHLIHVKKLFLH
ncbi:hypothetical protein CU098_013481 [Rhizopus stolonifer]|uniref:Uncharacterized protein n=1 Tax=Rhizopus stolonifer TaxID=4846 RepID=A0A367KWJ5_RHIST|nr:hypothetical protein CU098_013481 [Rhizopus stolonifer]